MSNVLAIVGRPNVGKSTLFNRLTQTQEAIVESVSGVTRDRIYGKSDWNGYVFSVIDTGGYVQGSDDTFESEIRKQVLFAIDGIMGLTIEDGVLLVTRDPDYAWHTLIDEISTALKDFFL